MSVIQLSKGDLVRSTSLYLPLDLCERVKMLGINRSAVIKAALEEAVRKKEQEESARALASAKIEGTQDTAQPCSGGAH